MTEVGPGCFALDPWDAERKIGILAVEDQYGQEGSGALIRELERGGKEADLILQHASGSVDPDGWINGFSSADVDLVVLYTYVKPAADLLRSAHSVGYQPDWLGSYVLSGPDLLELSGAQTTSRLRVTSYPSGPRSNRGERLFLKQMARLYPEVVPGSHSRIGYAAAQLVVEGLRRAGAELTRSAFIQGLESLQDWTGGLLPPISYSESDHRGLTGLALQRAINGRWILEKSLLKLKE